MSLSENCFYIGNVPLFLQIIKLIKLDSEFCLRLDFAKGRLEIESMMLSGVVGMGIRLMKGGSIIAKTPDSRNDCSILRVNSASFYQAMVLLSHHNYAYMCIGIEDDDDTLHIRTYTSEHVCIGSAKIATLNLEEYDSEFLVVNENKRDPLEFDIDVKDKGTMWKQFLQPSTVDTKIKYSNTNRNLTWETKNQQTLVSFYLPVTTSCTRDVEVCILPSVVSILRGVLQVTDKLETMLSISEDLPVRLFANFDTIGSFIRVYAGTKEDI